jgi:hypothetical protein
MNTVTQKQTILKRDFFYHALITGIFSKHDHFGNKNNDTVYQSNNISDQLIVLGKIISGIKTLEDSYRNFSKTTKINVDYGDSTLQWAYLFYYLHPYICQSYSTFNLHNLQSILNIDSDSVTISMFGCGPCPELIAFTDFLSVYFPHVNHINANVFDIAVDKWSYSRNIVEEHIIPKSWHGSFKINTHNIDLTKEHDFTQYVELSNSQIVTFQNCINEIVTESGIHRETFLSNIQSILSVMPRQSILLLSDLTGHAFIRDILEFIINDLNKSDNILRDKITVQKDYLTEKISLIGLGRGLENALSGNDYLQMQQWRTKLRFKGSVDFGSKALIKGEYNTSINISEKEYDLIISLANSQPGEEEQVLSDSGEVMNQNLICKIIRVQTNLSFNCFKGNNGKIWMSRLSDIIKSNTHQYLCPAKIPHRIDYFY